MELGTGSRPGRRPVLHYTDVCKRDIKGGTIDPAGWEAAASYPSGWRLAVKGSVMGRKPVKSVCVWGEAVRLLT